MEQAFDLGEVLPETLNAASEYEATSVRAPRCRDRGVLSEDRNFNMVDKTTRAHLA